MLTDDPLRHHGDVEATPGLLDLAVNVLDLPRPTWLQEAILTSLEGLARYPDPAAARAALALHHGRDVAEVLPTSGAAEAFTLIARLRPWHRPVVVHPQFTEPQVALEQAGHRVEAHVLAPPYVLDPEAVPADADLVVVGNPTNPTGVLHPREALLALRRPGRMVVVDEAFMDTVPGEPESLASRPLDDVVVIRSLTKHWGVPGLRAGHLLGPADVVAALERGQTPWSVSAPALAVLRACATPEARAEAERRARLVQTWRAHLEAGLTRLGVPHRPSTTSFVLATPGAGVHATLRERGVAVRRADTFPGLGPDHVRVAVRPPSVTDLVLEHLQETL